MDKVLYLLCLIFGHVVFVSSQSTCDPGLPPDFNPGATIDFKRPGLPNRKYYIYAPTGYSSTGPPTSKVILTFHGWCDSGRSYTTSSKFQNLANKYNMIIVAPTGLKTGFECNSWQNYGSNTGVGLNGVDPTCDTSQNSPNYCYSSCAPCANRCSWTHCLDDDIQFVRDLVVGGPGFENALQDKICFDPSQVYVSGTSNGGMFTWTLIQDPRTSGLFRAAAPIIGSPHCDYDFAGPDYVPVISLMGNNDSTVPSTNLPWPGHPSDECLVNRDGEGYFYISSNRIVSTWANSTCEVEEGEIPSRIVQLDNLICATWCGGPAPYAVDCYFNGGHIEPEFAVETAYLFFQLHSSDSDDYRASKANPFY